MTWRGYLTRATILAIGFGSYVLLSKKIDLSVYGKRCFYALRRYFPRGKKDASRRKDLRRLTTAGTNNDEECPVYLESSKTGVRVSRGHFLSSKQTTGPDLEKISTAVVNEFGNKTAEKVRQDLGSGYTEPDVTSDRAFHSFSTFCDKGLNYLGRIFLSFSILLAVGFVAMKLQMLNWREFIGYGSIFDFLIPLVLIPTIYIWFMYRDSRLTIQKERINENAKLYFS